jgi:hypothetical protein
VIGSPQLEFSVFVGFDFVTVMNLMDPLEGYANLRPPDKRRHLTTPEIPLILIQFTGLNVLQEWMFAIN